MESNYFSSKEFLALLKEYEQCEKQGVTCLISSDDYVDIAEYYETYQGNLELAEKVAKQAIQLYPEATAPLVFMARISLFKGESTDCIRHWTEQVKDTSDWEYRYLMAEIMIIEGKVQEADLYLQECFDEFDDENEDEEDVIYDIATLFCDYGCNEQCVKWLNMAENQDSSDYQEIMARLLISEGDYAKGEELLNHLIDSNPFVSSYWNSLANSQFQRNKFHDSITSSEYSIAINPNDDEAILNKANGLYQLGNYSDAADYYSRYIKLRPEDEYGDLFLGVCLICQNRLVEAEACLKIAAQKAEKTKRSLPDIYQELAFTESRLGKVDEAMENVNKAELSGADHHEMNVLRGHVMLENHNIDEAQLHFSKAVKESGASPRIFLRVAVSIYDNGYIHLAQKMLHMLLKDADDDWKEGYSYLAACAYVQHQREEWLKYLQTAVRKNPAEAMNVLGEFFPDDIEPQDYYQYALQH